MSDESSPLLPKELPATQTGVTYHPPEDPPFDAGQHRAVTAQHLAYWLLGILGTSVVAQYVTLHVLIWNGKGEAVPLFEHLFNAWLPVISGLASSAVTYYLTKEGK
jgi:hypothetical protein